MCNDEKRGITGETCVKTSGHVNGICEDLCVKIFNRNPTARCILYDEEWCNGLDGYVTLKDGKSFEKAHEGTRWGVESVSIKRGCQLTLWQKNNFKGKRITLSYKVGRKFNSHVTFKQHAQWRNFHDRVNSAKCTCNKKYRT